MARKKCSSRSICSGACAELLRSWQLPEVLCKSVQFSRYPELAQPSRIPVDVRANVAALYLARCCYDDLRAIEGAPPRLFVRDYLSALGYPDLSEEILLRERVLPKLAAQRRHLPVSLAASLETFGASARARRPHSPDSAK
ncbi:hypothetical protein [Allochromatium palmeri]|uniref:HDOD domain-containing protein n=1 Tax=Allochromatium palmeri TaxID=231048 RepID=A0A6N8EHW1_9GAMM|nr:hypothetical protein [Allochromatium palmeri]MTW23201.1 hypothetical protein [Allochromatium palmeri]